MQWKSVIGTFLDISVDRVSHVISFDKVYHHSIRDATLACFRCYVTGRWQSVMYKGSASLITSVFWCWPMMYVNCLIQVWPQSITVLYTTQAIPTYFGEILSWDPSAHHQIGLGNISLRPKVTKLSVNIFRTHNNKVFRCKCCFTGIKISMVGFVFFLKKLCSLCMEINIVIFVVTRLKYFRV